ncbi:FecR domain-containing protein [Leptothermofonsia sichuanensis E412]|uniref:FecR domain-containing protein n=1 Tax=Leptothermofonsia sichuanensis TaxID=2917832 RepID=UPI001CA773D7|nr:FecR domain-containing protein [Leptothermofonsia sichuanensis]QZZ23154.1 FecR domain-containing protein [Leptothermofonsia sichuanensis E412]
MNRNLRKRLTWSLTVAVWGGSLFLLPIAVRAETPLTRAVVQSIRNSVRLLQQNQAPRPARVRDAMAPGDALSTARLSLAELKFNDGSLARVGEQALFQFLPRTRTFRLNNGTVLLLIPPGQGQTRIQTPNAATGIRGSALFVRYVPETETTLVGALTTSGIEVANRDRTQNQPLAGGQMAVIVQNRIERVYNFDLRTFYETSDLVKGLSLSGGESSRSADPAIAAVQKETIAAIEAQTPITDSRPAQNLMGIGTVEPQTGSPGSDRRPEFETVVPPNPGDLTLPQSATASQPSQFPLTGVIPRSPGQDALGIGSDGAVSGRGNNPAGRTGTAPGLAGTTPGQSNSGPPGQTGTPPGLTGTAPGLAGTTPGQSNSGPPGQTGTPPGLTGTAPGLAGTTPGQSGNGPPGLTGTAPGLVRNTPAVKSR